MSESGRPDDRSIPLSRAPRGVTVRIVRLTGGHGMVRRLSDMGLHRGSEITVVRNEASGPLIVRCKGSRLALGRGVLDRVMVQPVE